MDGIMSLLKDFDIAALLPEIGPLMRTAQMVIWVLTLIGPVLLLVLGALYYFKPPKEANYSWGFRTYFTMGSEEMWRFTQKVAGLSWIILGGVLSVTMLVMGAFLLKTDITRAGFTAFWCMIGELALLIVSWFVIHAIVLRFFDLDGNRRIK